MTELDQTRILKLLRDKRGSVGSQAGAIVGGLLLGVLAVVIIAILAISFLNFIFGTSYDPFVAMELTVDWTLVLFNEIVVPIASAIWNNTIGWFLKRVFG